MQVVSANSCKNAHDGRAGERLFRLCEYGEALLRTKLSAKLSAQVALLSGTDIECGSNRTNCCIFFGNQSKYTFFSFDICILSSFSAIHTLICTEQSDII